MSIVEGPQKPKPNSKKEEPKEADPAPSKTLESDTDEFIQSMENHIASTETRPSTQSTQTQGENSESPKKTQPQPEKPQQTDESDSGSQGIEEVVSSTSSQEEVMVDPTTLDPPVNTLNDTNKPKRDEKKKKE